MAGVFPVFLLYSTAFIVFNVRGKVNNVFYTYDYAFELYSFRILAVFLSYSPNSVYSVGTCAFHLEISYSRSDPRIQTVFDRIQCTLPVRPYS